MALKLANTEENNKDEGGLRLSGGQEKPGTDTQTEQANPWDFDRPEESLKTRSVSSTAPDSSTYKSSAYQIHPVVKIGRIVVYVDMLFMIIAMASIGAQPKLDIYLSIIKLSPIFSVCELLLIVDAVLVNVLYEKKISLIFWAWLLAFVYPLKRDKHVNGGSSWGGLICIGIIMASVFLASNMVVASLTYGLAIVNVDEAERAEIKEFVEYTAAEGEDSFGERLKRNFTVENIVVEKQGNQTIMVFQGIGRYSVNENAFLDHGNNSVETQLAFVKDSSGDYQLGAVLFGDVQLSEYYMQHYWENLIQ